MRDVSREVVRAFLECRPKKIKATESVPCDPRLSDYHCWLKLHGNIIAIRLLNGDITLSMCGWGSPTTRERLNAICELTIGCRPYHQHNHDQYFGSTEIGAHDTIRLLSDGKGGWIYTDPDAIMLAQKMVDAA